MDYSSIDNMLEHLYEYINKKLDDSNVELVTEFARQYFSMVAFEDINTRQIDDLYGAVLSHWNLALEKQPGTENIHIYNPTLEEHGWQSPHTVIEIVIEDMPFLLQSVTMEINRQGFSNHQVIHPVYAVERKASGELSHISAAGNALHDSLAESMMHLEIDRQSDKAQMQLLQQGLRKILANVRAATQDWKKCLAKMGAEIQALKQSTGRDANNKLDESVQFLQWLYDGNFVFLGYREYQILHQHEQAGFKVVPESGLGILRDSIAALPADNFIALTADAFARLISDQTLMITKATSKSSVHRPVFMDYIGIKQYDEKGVVVAEKRFLGLYSSSAYSCGLNQIPMVNGKISRLLERSAYLPNTHGSRALLFVVQSLPRDELFQTDEDSLLECATGVLQLQERQRVRVFVRHDVYGHFVSLLIFVPRERYHTESRKKIQQILLETFHGQNVDFSVQLSESILARIHFIIHCSESCRINYSVKEIEQKIVEALAEWQDDLKKELHNYFGEAKGNEYLQSYADGFSAAYREDVTARTALLDIRRFEQLLLREASPLGLLYSPLTASEKKTLHFKLYCYGQPASLSKSLPMLENMGVKVCDERPYEINNKDMPKAFWIHDFGLIYEHMEALNMEELKPRFQEAYEQCWNNKTEDDGFNRLVIRAGLDWRQVNIIRAFYLYLRQIDITFSQNYVELTLANNPGVVQLLIALFYLRFDPALDRDEKKLADMLGEIEHAIDQVSSLDEDRILRRYLNLIQAAVRTNFFKDPLGSESIPYFAIKFNSATLFELPSPVPYFEIFVYSPRMEGIHLRGGAVARGGLRWSDRLEDFRTEILSLMKAQMTKNAVIVPTGAKGGFTVKHWHKLEDKQEKTAEVVACYRILISGLLDLTDNYQDDKIVKPEKVICYDQDDPYLVVAADKGTATFSDYANALSKQYDFWLGDAFASGGSAGYDHKSMGITARGAWESVKHHFETAGMDMQSSNFKVVGIGGMTGDVFGNGMLLSRHIKLLGAFDHEAIFLDPLPDPEQSYLERKRLFALPRCAWNDYDKNLISKGGGVFSRHDKAIVLSREVKEMLDIDMDKITPNELIRHLLCASVDLLWNGGIGTYVKGSEERHADVGDRANDAVRVNGRQLRCKCVGEGGNLGFTQKGRIEFALKGGKINTDSIDNSAGVDCSDHEVNIKILLNSLVKHGDLTDKQRNALLEEMTDQVAELVLKHNYHQNQAITMIAEESVAELPMLLLLIEILESKAHLNRQLECLPDNEMFDERRLTGKGLTRPEISVLLAYSKQQLKTELLQEADQLDQDLLRHELLSYFPTQLQQRFASEITRHRLGREIVANALVNSLINRLGIVFPYRLKEELGSSAVAVLNTYKLVSRVFEIEKIWILQADLDGHLEAGIYAEVKQTIRKTIERSMYWFLRNEQLQESVDNIAHDYVESINTLASEISILLPDNEQKLIDAEVDRYIKGGISATLALKVAQLDSLFLCLNVVKVHRQTGASLQDVFRIMFYVIAELKLNWLRDKITRLPKEKLWESLARQSMRDEFHNTVCVLSIDVLNQSNSKIGEKLSAWFDLNNKAISRYRQLVKMITAEDGVELEKIAVVLNDLALMGKK